MSKRSRKDEGTRCAAWNCSKSKLKDNIGVFEFPNRDKSPERHKFWCSVVSRTRADFVYSRGTSRLCADHFDESSISNIGYIRHLQTTDPEAAKKTRWRLFEHARPNPDLMPKRSRHGTILTTPKVQAVPSMTGKSVRSTSRSITPHTPDQTTAETLKNKSIFAKRNGKRDKAGFSIAAADVTSSLVTDPVWSGQENALGSNQEIIEKHSRSKEIKTEQSPSDEYLDGSESKVYIDVAEHPEDLRKREHSMSDWEEFPSDSDGRKYIKTEDDIDEKIDISKECMFAEPYEEQETLGDWSQVTNASLTNIKQEPDSDNIVLSREMT